jgi:ATP-dependent RNA helicase DDX19/DBP5
VGDVASQIAGPGLGRGSHFQKLFEAREKPGGLQAGAVSEAQPGSAAASAPIDDQDGLYRCNEAFEGLLVNKNVLRGLFMGGYDRPSKIQSETLPVMLVDPPVNMIAQGQSGTGKTVAFGVGILQRLDPNVGATQAIVVEPAFELAQQTADVIRRMAEHTYENVTVRAALKGQRLDRGEKIRDHIVIGTPGKLQDWIFRQRALSLSEIRVFVFDEADQMLAVQGHRDQSIRIYKTLDLDRVQILLFSATYAGEVREFMDAVVPDPRHIIDLRPEELTVKNIRQLYVTCGSEEKKYEAIANLYGFLTVGSSIVFCRTRVATNWLAQKMRSDLHPVAILSGEMSIEERNDVMTRFRNGFDKVLITTDVLARGIDIDHVTLVVNYDLPLDSKGQPEFEMYLHRIGRTGRFGRKGIALNIIDSAENEEKLMQIADYYKCAIEHIDFENVDDLLRISNEQSGRVIRQVTR